MMNEIPIPEEIRKTPRALSPDWVFPTGMAIKGITLWIFALICSLITFQQTLEAYQNAKISKEPGEPGLIISVNEAERYIEYTFQDSTQTTRTERITYQKFKGRFPKSAAVGQPVEVWEQRFLWWSYPATHIPDNNRISAPYLHNLIMMLFFGLLAFSGIKDLVVTRQHRKIAQYGVVSAGRVTQLKSRHAHTIKYQYETPQGSQQGDVVLKYDSSLLLSRSPKEGDIVFVAYSSERPKSNVFLGFAS